MPDLKNENTWNINESKTNIDEKINKQMVSFTDKIDEIFNRIGFLELNWEKKAEVALKVKEDALWDKLYWIEIFLSGMIAALWLLINSVAVIIWAMLIAPLLRPMNGISFAISMWEKYFFWKSVKVMFYSVLLSIFTWYIAINFSWLEIETSEILARTSPNIIDLFIAIFSAMVAVLSLRFDRLSESVAWVALAAALMPPLAVVWIELALGNYELSFWALMLFVANLVSIILIWVIFFWLYWFSPNTWKKQKMVLTRTLFVLTTIILISIPLITSLIAIKEKISITKETTSYLQNILKEKTDSYKIKELEVEKINKETIKINSTISIPEWLDFYDTFQDKLNSELGEMFKKNVELNIELIRTANILSDKDKVVDREKELIDNLENKLNLKLDEKTLEQQEYLKKEILDEIRNLLEEENLKIINSEEYKKIINISNLEIYNKAWILE